MKSPIVINGKGEIVRRFIGFRVQEKIGIGLINLRGTKRGNKNLNL